MKQTLCIAWTFFVLSIGYLHAQDCECDKNYEKIFVDQKDQWMNGMYHDDKQMGGHPYSTFSKTHPGSYIEGNNNPKTRLNAIREMVQDFQSKHANENTPVDLAKKIYYLFYDLAIDGKAVPDNKVDKESKYPHNTAYVAKAVAFVYLCDMDKKRQSRLASITHQLSLIIHHS